MFETPITYTDLNGDEQTETYAFHLTKENVVDLNVSPKGGLENYLQEIIASEDGAAVMENLRAIVRMAVGRRSEDGKRFEKDPVYASQFMQSEAYSELFFRLVSDAEFAAEFINKTMPSGMKKQLEDTKKTYSDEELLSMSDEQFEKVVGSNVRNMTKEHIGIAMKRRNRVG